MSKLHNGFTHGINGHTPGKGAVNRERFSNIPTAIDIPVTVVADDDDAGGQDVEVDLVDLPDDPTELCQLLEMENLGKKYWLTVSLAYAKQGDIDRAIEIITQGLSAINQQDSDQRLGLLSCLCWLYLWKCREAPRVRPEGQLASDIRTKDFYIQSATSTMNDATRISPAYQPLFLARGVLCLLRASLQPQGKSSVGVPENSERVSTLRQAAKCFEDAARGSRDKNMMALLGKARVQYSLGKYAEALQCYQSALERAPDLRDPDPRIGIGCCFWQLGFKDDAKEAWERSLELSPGSRIAMSLLGLYYLQSSSNYNTNDPEFAITYKKAMTEYIQKAFKLDERNPLTCATFSGYFLMRKAMQQTETLARRAIELTDVNAIASDGWYLLARKEHYANDIKKAREYYEKADLARGGDAQGYAAAKFGAAQMQVLNNDLDGAKFRLEKLLQQFKSPEAQALLGTLYAEECFAAQAAKSKEDKSLEHKKAIALLESVRISWKDPKRKVNPDAAVSLNLARLYETENPDKALQCLQQVERMEVDAIPQSEWPDVGDLPQSDEPEKEPGAARQAAIRVALRKFLPPQLLNNIGSFHWQAGKLTIAREYFQAALDACNKLGEKENAADIAPLVTTISYNLARTFESEDVFDEAKRIYNEVLEARPTYTDAKTRLAYISLKQNPGGEGPKITGQLLKAEPSNMEVRGLYGWFLSKAKRRTMKIAEDQEQRHYKHTLQNYDKHDRYSLTGMGNIYLTIAREMPRNTEMEKADRRRQYEKALEFFDKALLLDPRNAYAAQGVAICWAEDQRDFAGAIQIFSKVKETLKEASVYMNLGHAFCELRQYSRAIENYEIALSQKDRSKDPGVLGCLGRVWLMRGKAEKSLVAMKNSLDYSRLAYEITNASNSSSGQNVHFKFNIAFVQMQIAQFIHSQHDPSLRTVEDVETAAKGLDEAIEGFSEVAALPNPPFPRGDIEQRVRMGRNSMRGQLEEDVRKQREYQEANAARLQQAREQREIELKKREEEKRRAAEELEERRRVIAEERARMQQADKEMAQSRLEESLNYQMEQRRREEEAMTTDSETGERRKRTKKRGSGGKRKTKADDDSGIDDRSDLDDAADGEKAYDTDGNERERPPRRSTKKRKLERRSGVTATRRVSSKRAAKFKSSEQILDSDEEIADEESDELPADDDGGVSVNGGKGSAVENGDGGEAEPSTAAARKRGKRVVDEDDDDDDDGGDLSDLPDAPPVGADEDSE